MSSLRHRIPVVVTALAALTLLGAPGTAPAATFAVKATGDAPTNFRWMPDFRHIVKGNRVRWKNPTEATHRVVSYSGPWSKNTAIAPGETTSKRFRKPGKYLYRCTMTGHSTLSNGECRGMCGEVHVTRS